MTFLLGLQDNRMHLSCLSICSHKRGPGNEAKPSPATPPPCFGQAKSSTFRGKHLPLKQ